MKQTIISSRYTAVDIADELDISLPTIQRAITNLNLAESGRTYTDHQLEQIRAWLRENYGCGRRREAFDV